MNGIEAITGSTIKMSANSVAQNVALPAGGIVCRVANDGPQTGFVDFFTSNLSVASVPDANGGSFPVQANQSVNLFVPVAATRVSGVSAGNATLYFTKVQVK